ncbi:MAG: hypothetical protein ABI333_29905 [bacterium]
MRTKRIFVAASLVASLLLMGCGDDDGGSSGVCGDGVKDADEACDIIDLGGVTCVDIGFVGGGALACTDQCVFDTTGCSSCGDGALQAGEDCDCGLDGGNLPAGCDDINGGAAGMCNADCTVVTVCGNGVEESGEDCDCGDDPSALPGGCQYVNGDPRGTCDEFCGSQNQCGPGDEPFDDCDVLNVNSCCPDPYGEDMACFSGSSSNYCLRECVDANDCYYSNECGDVRDGACWPAICGPGWPITEVNVPCAVNGTAGFCWPIFTRDEPDEEPFAYCVEAGTLPHGSVCDDNASISETDRSVDYCDFGTCLGGTCVQFCVGDESHDAAIYGAGPGTETYACPAGSNCFSESHFDQTTGVRTNDLSYCRLETDARTCSLVGAGQLLTDPAQICDDIEVDGYCDFTYFSGGNVTEGTLIGRCRAGDGVIHMIWEPCDPTSATRDCPSGTACVEEDYFDAGTGTARCVPYCDTDRHDGITATCGDLDEAVGVDPTYVIDASAVCTSLSQAIEPLDIYPSRVGLCTIETP